jgi:hypothetical protein
VVGGTDPRVWDLVEGGEHRGGDPGRGRTVWQG